MGTQIRKYVMQKERRTWWNLGGGVLGRHRLRGFVVRQPA
jgi:hypothetical protein